MKTTPKNWKFANKLWQVEISPDPGGRIERLTDRSTGTVCVQTPEPRDPKRFDGLEWWVKAGTDKDPNTGVIAAFAPVHRAPAKAQPRADGVRFIARKGGLVWTLDWSLPAGAEPLIARLTLLNESAPTNHFQFEAYFTWHRSPSERPRTVIFVPGLEPLMPAPYLEVRYDAGASGENRPSAAWWELDRPRGVVLRGRKNIDKFCYGVEWARMVVGCHSRAARLARGEQLTAEIEIFPWKEARKRGFAPDDASAKKKVAAQKKGREIRVREIGDLRRWAATPKPFFARRALYLVRTPVKLKEAIQSLEKIAPAGFNTLYLEVGDGYPYRSHPKVTPDWAWSRATWTKYLKAARSLGFETIPAINSLGHQTETGLTRAYPELREDPDGWALCPRNPRSARYLCEMYDELIELFQPTAFHVGLDEVEMTGKRLGLGLCPKCRGADAARLFADHILALHQHISGRGLEMSMWADMLCWDLRQGHNNGMRTGAWRAIERLPRDITLVNWLYSAMKDYRSTQYFLDQGFRVMGATWNTPKAVAEYARFAADRRMGGMMETTWSGLCHRGWPLDCVLLAGKYFQDPHYPDFNRAAAEAIALAHAMA
jgi:hypothetical protein